MLGPGSRPVDEWGVALPDEPEAYVPFGEKTVTCRGAKCGRAPTVAAGLLGFIMFSLAVAGTLSHAGTPSIESMVLKKDKKDKHDDPAPAPVPAPSPSSPSSPKKEDKDDKEDEPEHDPTEDKEDADAHAKNPFKKFFAYLKKNALLISGITCLIVGLCVLLPMAKTRLGFGSAGGNQPYIEHGAYEEPTTPSSIAAFRGRLRQVSESLGLTGAERD